MTSDYRRDLAAGSVTAERAARLWAALENAYYRAADIGVRMRVGAFCDFAIEVAFSGRTKPTRFTEARTYGVGRAFSYSKLADAPDWFLDQELLPMLERLYREIAPI